MSLKSELVVIARGIEEAVRQKKNWHHQATCQAIIELFEKNYWPLEYKSELTRIQRACVALHKLGLDATIYDPVREV